MIKTDDTKLANDVFWAHPELQPGEVFLCNLCQMGFDILQCTSKRMGNIAYDGEGRQLTSENWRPVFIKLDEIKSGIDIKTLRTQAQDVPGCQCPAHVN